MPEETGDAPVVPGPRKKTAICRTCREPIHRGARKCTECESYQDWRRFAAIGDTSLSLVVAGLSVLTVLVPLVVRALEADEEEIVVSVAQVEPEMGVARFIASNLGTRTGALRAVELRVPGKEPWPLEVFA